MKLQQILLALTLITVLPLGKNSRAAGEDFLTTPRLQSAPVVREYTIGTVEWQWFDAARDRSLPVKIYYPAAGDGPFPVVVFSSGLGRTCRDCAYLGDHWAARGLIAVFVQHPGCDDAVWRGKVQPMKHLKEACQSPTNAKNRYYDMRFVLDQLERERESGAAWARKLDLWRLGAAGCDMGAQTVLTLAGEMLPRGDIAADPRIRAVVAMSPPAPRTDLPLEAVYAAVRIPCLYMTGSEDNGLAGSTKAGERRLAFDNAFGSDQYLITFAGGDHLIFAGHPVRQREMEKDARFQPLIRDAATLFWQAYLEERPDALAAIQGSGLHALLGKQALVEQKTPSRPAVAKDAGGK
jgi:predicted dienelactone hydrolase